MARALVKTRFASLPSTAKQGLPATTMDDDRYRPAALGVEEASKAHSHK
jgi:hypothetical protein